MFDKLSDLRQMGRAYFALLALVEVGLIDLLCSQDVVEFASASARLSIDDRALRMMIGPLVAENILTVNQNGLRLTQSLTQADRERLNDDCQKSHHLMQLSTILLTGKPSMLTQIGTQLDDIDASIRFLRSLRLRSTDRIKQAVRVLMYVWEDCVKQKVSHAEPTILDLGGGHGGYSDAFMEAFPYGTVVCFDLPHITPIIGTLRQQAFDLVGGDFFSDSLGGPYSIVFVSNVIHGLNRAETLALLAQIHKHTESGGAVVILDKFVVDHGVRDPAVLDFNLTLLIETENGYCKSVNETFDMLRQSNFAPLMHYQVDNKGSFVVGLKETR